MNIYLIGFRCTGKTSVGKKIAEQLGWEFIDSDVEIVRISGMTIAEIVSAKGWSAFRKQEKEVIQQIAEKDKQVIATGGGVILDSENIHVMKKSGVVIWLKAEPANIRKRMISDHKTSELRPALTPKGTSDEIEDILCFRTPLYENAKHFKVDTDFQTVEAVSELVINILITQQKKDKNV